MNDLYRAVEILGRSVEDVDKYGWGFCTLGSTHAQKCVNGTLAIAAMQSRPMYVHQVIEANRELAGPMRMACIALVQTAPRNIVDSLLFEEVWLPETIRTQRLTTLDMEALGELLVNVNDQDELTGDYDEDGDPIKLPMLTQKGARDWYDRALDLLAKDLPEPIPADPPLTVQQILAAGETCTGYICETHGSLQHDDETCPIHEMA